MVEFLAIAVVGAVLSAIMQIIKEKFGTDSGTSKFLVIGLSLIVGGVYVWVRSTPYWETALTVLMSASTVYALLIKK